MHHAAIQTAWRAGPARVRGGVVVAFAFLLLAGCGERPASEIALKPSDVGGASPCPNSGSLDHLLAVRGTIADPNSGADRDVWSSLKAAGAVDSYVQVYAGKGTDPARCRYGISGGYGTGIDNVVVRFGSNREAHDAWASGSLIGWRPPADTTRLYRQVTGSATGLGDDSVVFTGVDELGVAYWARGAVVSLVQAQADRLTTESLARHVDARM